MSSTRKSLEELICQHNIQAGTMIRQKSQGNTHHLFIDDDHVPIEFHTFITYGRILVDYCPQKN